MAAATSAAASSSASLDTFESGPPLAEVYYTDEQDGHVLLGRGKFSVVHRTCRKADSLPVALKTIQIFEMGSRERHECLNEIRLLQQMKHAHIICYLDCKMERNELTVVMELAGHGDLARLIRTRAKAGTPLGEPMVWCHFVQIADALAYMHERRVMHRDIKPANVFISDGAASDGADGGDGDGGSGTVMKLGDLGLGRYFSSQTDVTHSTVRATPPSRLPSPSLCELYPLQSPHLSCPALARPHTLRPHAQVGTPYYMSPECIQGGGYDFKSDIWSLGCLLYELTTLRSPFYSNGLNFYMLGKRIMARQFEPLVDASVELVQLVDRMLQVDPADRPTAAEVFALATAATAAHSDATPS